MINQLLSIYNNYDMIQRSLASGSFVWELKKRQVPHCQDLARLEQVMKQTRSNDFSEYFNTHHRVGNNALRITRAELRLF